MQAAKYLSPQVHFVAGYQIDEIVSRYLKLHYTINSEWADTGPIASLLEAKVQENSRCIVSYGDILFREKTVKELLALDSDIAIAVDSIWKERFISRSIDDINRSEKVLISGNKLLNQNIDNLEDSVDAEFIGLLTFKSEVMNFIQEKSDLFKTDMRNDTLITLVEFLQQNNFTIKVVDVKGDWAELKTNDLANFILGTKAQSLKRLEDIITEQDYHHR